MRVAAVVIVGLALVACGSRSHLTQSHGRSYHTAFARQDAAPSHRTKPAEALTGLDSQEAAIVASSYRNSLSPKGAEVAEPAPVLIVAPESQSQRRPVAPSVPK